MATRGKAETLLAYVAGVIDSDGCITLERAKSKVNVKERRVTPRIIAKVGVVNTSLALVELLQKEFGGSILIRKKNAAHHKTIYHWRLTTVQAAKFCKEIYPFLVVKRIQALCVIVLHNHKIDYDQGTNNRWRCSDKEVALREKLYKFCHEAIDDRRPQRLIEATSGTDDVIV